MMGMCAGLLGPKSGNVDFIQVFVCFFEGQGRHEYAKESFQVERAGAVGGGRGRVNPPPRRLVWRFWKVWRVCTVSPDRFGLLRFRWLESKAGYIANRFHWKPVLPKPVLLQTGFVINRNRFTTSEPHSLVP